MILPWSPSSLESLETCERNFYETKVAKSCREYPSAAADWGNRVHDSIERFLHGEELPEELGDHAEVLRKIAAKTAGREFFTERKAAFDRQGGALFDWDSPELWARFKIDLYILGPDHERPIAWCYDFKSGRPHQKLDQLAAYALWIFAAHPEIELVSNKYYFLQTKTFHTWVCNRKEIPEIWNILLPKLTHFRECFRTNIWRPKQGWKCSFCPVEDCEFWQNGRSLKGRK